MLRQFIFGGGVSVCNIAIHAFMMTLVVQVARITAKSVTTHSSLLLIGVMIAAVSVLMIAHAFEVIVWSLAYWIVDAAPGSKLVYFAFVNYTTLGYGDVIPVPRVATARPDHGDERRIAVWLVYRRYFRDPAQDDDDHCLGGPASTARALVPKRVKTDGKQIY